MASYSSGIQVDIGQIVSDESPAVDWSSKTPKFNRGVSDLTVNGSGYIIGLWIDSASDGELNFELTVDGNTFTTATYSRSSVPLFYRFNSSFSLSHNSVGSSVPPGVSYVLD